jgi:hypothetical protein
MKVGLELDFGAGRNLPRQGQKWRAIVISFIIITRERVDYMLQA